MYTYGSAIQRFTEGGDSIFLTRVLGHLLDMFRLTVHMYSYGSAIQRLTEGGDAHFFDARSGPPSSYAQIELTNRQFKDSSKVGTQFF